MRTPLDPMQRLSQWLRKLESRIKTLETTPRLQNSSISKGALRILSEEGLIVVGSAKIDGTMKGSGTFDWTGPMNLKGAQSVTGPTTFTGRLTVDGPWSLDGNGDITGDVNISGDLSITAGGQVEVAGSEPIRLRQSGGLARVEFGDAGTIWSGGDGITIAAASGGYINVYSGGVDLYGPVQIVNMPTVAQSAYPGSFPGAVVSDSSGNLRRVV